MTARLMAAALAVALAAPAGFAAPDDTGLPANVLQIQPLGKTLTDVKAVVKSLGGDKAVKDFDAKVQEKLGDKGFAGLDLTKPVYGYQFLKDDLDDPAGVLILPVTTEKEFLALLKRLDIEADPAKADATAYDLNMPDALDPKGKDVRLRFKDGYAYVGVNVEAANLTAAKLPATSALAIPDETALLVFKTYLKRIPKDVREKATASIDKAAEQFDALPLPDVAKEKLGDAMKVAKRYTQLQYDQGDSTLFRVTLDPKTPELGWDYVLTPLAGSKLAGDLAARKPTTNRFAGLLNKDTTAGFVTRLPLFLPELRAGAADLIGLGEGFAVNAAPEPYQPAAKAALAGLARTAKTGQFDLAAGLTGPTADGKFSLSVGVAFEDPKKLEDELRTLYADAPDQVKGVVKLDAATSAAGVKIHKANLGAFLPPEAQAVFSDEATVAFAFAPKGIYVVVGKDSVATLKTALGYDPKPAKVLDVVINPQRMAKLADATGNANLRKAFPADGAADGLKSLASIAVEGGKELVVHGVFNLKLAPKGGGGDE